MIAKKLYPSLTGIITLLLLIIGITTSPALKAEAITITFSNSTSTSPNVIKETITKTITKTIMKTVTETVKGNKTVRVVEYTPYTVTEYVGIILRKTTFQKTFTFQGHTFTFKKIFTLTYHAGDVEKLEEGYQRSQGILSALGGIGMLMFIFGAFGAIILYKRKREVEKWQL